MPLPPVRTVLWRGARLRCPACGAGRVFRTFLRLRRACGACGWILEREPGAATGAMYLLAILSQLFAALLLLLGWALTDWTPVTMVAVAVPVLVAFCLYSLRLSKGLWIAVDYATDVKTGEAATPGYRARAYTENC